MKVASRPSPSIRCPQAPASFTTPASFVCFVDTVTADFAAGTAFTNVYVSETDDGELTLLLTAAAEFGGTAQLRLHEQSV